MQEVSRRLAGYEAELVAVRRDLHAHPELGRAEVRTTRVLRERLTAAGLRPRVLPTGTGLLCDVGDAGRLVALRADLDALPVPDAKDVPYRSTQPGVCHACGHDVHAAAVLGAGLVCADLAAAGRLPGRVRLVFQPAEELTPGGALDVVAAGGLDGVERIFAVHCAPGLAAGLVGLRAGPVTAAADALRVCLTGPGGHTARPHLTADLVYALAKVVTEVPAALSRRVDPRAGMSLVWGRIEAGRAANAIPQAAEAAGTVRCLDLPTWQQAPELVESLVRSVVAAYAATVQVDYQRGVPPVVNDPVSTALVAAAASEVLGAESVVPTEQSLGGEDFAWYLEQVPGALVRVGVAGPAGGVDGRGTAGRHDLHQGAFDVDERAVGVAARVLAATAVAALG
ncbi:MAG: amidohydrolase [Actinomycetota bacterium]